MKSFILRHTKIYMLLCWLVLWNIDSLLGLPVAVNTLLVLIVGYLANVIWLMRLTSKASPQSEKTYPGKKAYSCTIVES